jgi:seryl-tRNA synthetase
MQFAVCNNKTVGWELTTLQEDSMNAELQIAYELIARLTDELEAALNEINELRDESGMLSMKIQELVAANGQLSDMVIRMMKDMDGLRQQLVTSKNNNSRLQMECNNLVDEINMMLQESVNGERSSEVLHNAIVQDSIN